MVKKFSLGMPDFVTIRTEEKELITTFENGQAVLDDVAAMSRSYALTDGRSGATSSISRFSRS